MRRKLILGLGLTAAMGVLSGCTEESPTSVGGDLIGEGFRTFEVVLDAATFLDRDTTYDRFGTLNAAPFGLVAESFAGELTAHTLFRVRAPARVTYQNAEGTSITDTAFTVVGGTVQLILDSQGEARPPVELQIMEVTESWDVATASWELRVDSTGVSEPWTTPGGTTDRVMGMGIWLTGDTVLIPLDSAEAAIWMDTTAANRGGLIRANTPGSRLRIQGLSFQFDVRPSSADTIVQAGSAGANVIVATPEPPAPDGTELRVGGLPIWRSALRFLPLADVQIPCEPGSTNCTVSLRDVDINRATLVLRPNTVAGHRIERPLKLEARGILRATGVPVNRSPLSPAVDSSNALPSDAFDGASTESYEAVVPLTGFVRQNIAPGEGREAVAWIALLARAEQSAPLFGYAEFGAALSATPPELRLMVTVESEEETQ